MSKLRSDTPRRQQIAPTPFAYCIPVAAQMIGIAPSTLWAKIKDGEIEARKIGAATVIATVAWVADLDEPVQRRAA